jgi:hypothetical protein
MSVLGAYWQDIQFQQGGGVGVYSVGAAYRSAYSQGAVQHAASQGNPAKTNPFLAGAVTTAWITWQSAIQTTGTNQKALGGVGQSSSFKGLFVGTDPSNQYKLAIWKYDGTTFTQVGASELGASIPTTGLTAFRLDLQIVNYGATANVNLYVGGVLVIALTSVDVTVTGMTNFDCFTWQSFTLAVMVSEVIVATDDSRSFVGLQTLALTGAGTTNAWTNNTYSNINAVPFTDATPASDNNNGDIQEYAITPPISPGSFSYVAIVQAARMAKSASPAVTHVELGYNDVTGGGGVGFGAGATKALTTSYDCYEQIDAVNPLTGVAFVQGSMTAMQLAAKAIT